MSYSYILLAGTDGSMIQRIPTTGMQYYWEYTTHWGKGRDVDSYCITGGIEYAALTTKYYWLLLHSIAWCYGVAAISTIGNEER